jgi:hypothetical protein
MWIELRAMLPTWGLSTVLPLPVLVAIDPARSGDVACIYLGLSCAWLVAEFHRSLGLPQSSPAWRTRVLALCAAVAVNVAMFVAFGMSGGVETHFPFPLMATLAAIPAVGVVPFFLRRLPTLPYAAVLFSGLVVFACKLAACVVARVVYGPDYIEQGYVSADWRTAKLMISLMWTFSTCLSAAMLVADYRQCATTDRAAMNTVTAAAS